jgi:DNA modification methylase
LRDYGVDGQLGLESTPEEYVANMVQVFREVKRVLRDDGTLWLNLGDSYAGSGRCPSRLNPAQEMWNASVPLGLKPKDLVGIPWRVAFALQADGWYLRSDIIWHKPNPMPESVTDRPTKSHEYIFLMSKNQRYYYDGDAIREAIKPSSGLNMRAPKCGENRPFNTLEQTQKTYNKIKGANRRSVWTFSTKPYKEAHFAVFPSELITPCIKAGCPEQGIVLDPFSGSGTVAEVCCDLNRQFIGIELNPDYCALAEQRIAKATAQMRIF